MLHLDLDGLTSHEVVSHLYHGLLLERSKLDAKLEAIKLLMSAPATVKPSKPVKAAKTKAPAKKAATKVAAPKGKMSDEARARIVEAQRKRWAKVRKQKRQEESHQQEWMKSAVASAKALIQPEDVAESA